MEDSDEGGAIAVEEAFDEAAFVLEQEEQFYSDINSTEINLADKFRKARMYSILFFPTELADDRLQKYIFVLEDGFKILLQNDDDSFTKLFEFLKSSQEEAFMLISLIRDFYTYITKLTLLLQKAGDTEKAKMKFKKITRFCLLAVSRHKISAKYSVIRTTCQHLNINMSHIKELDMMNEILDEIVKIMKTCEKDKPRDFGCFRLLKGHIMKRLGKPKESLAEYEKAQDLFRKLVFNWIDKKGKKSKDENVLQVVNRIAEDYKSSEQYIFLFWKGKKEYMKAINIYERYVKKNEVIKMFVMSMEAESKDDEFDKKYEIGYRGLEERLELGRCYFQVKNYRMALQHFKIVIEENSVRIEDQILYHEDANTKLRFHGCGMVANLPDFDTFDLLDMVITCHKKLEFGQDTQEKADIYLTSDMELIWQKETSMTQEEIYEEYDHYDDLLSATVILCMKTYWTQIHRVNLNDFYYRKLQKIRIPKRFASDDEKHDMKVFQFSLKVIDIFKSQTNRNYLPEFYPAVYDQYINYKYYDEAMDILMEWLDYKDRDFDWNSRMINCLSAKNDYKEVEPYLIDCLEMIADATRTCNFSEWSYLDLFLIFEATSSLLFYHHDKSYPFNPMLDNFFELFLSESKRLRRHFILEDAEVLYDYVNGNFLQKIGSYEEETLTVKLVKFACLSSQRKEIIIDMVTYFIGIKTCFFKGIWRKFSSQYSIRSLQDEVLKALIENYECLNESQENVRLFANSCFLTRYLKNKAIS